MTRRRELPADELTFVRTWVWAEILAIARRVEASREGDGWLAREGISADAPLCERIDALTGYVWLVIHDPARARARAAHACPAYPKSIDAAVRMVISRMHTERKRETERAAPENMHTIEVRTTQWSEAAAWPQPDDDRLHADFGRHRPAARPTPAPEAPVTA